MEIGTKHKKTCPALTGFIRTCAGCGVVPSQGRTVSAGSRDVQRSSYHPVTSQHLICYQLERKALNFTAARLCSCLCLSWLPSSLMGKDAQFCRGICLTWCWHGSGPSCCQGFQNPSFPSASALNSWERMGSRNPRPQGNWPLLRKLKAS